MFCRGPRPLPGSVGSAYTCRHAGGDHRPHQPISRRRVPSPAMPGSWVAQPPACPAIAVLRPGRHLSVRLAVSNLQHAVVLLSIKSGALRRSRQRHYRRCSGDAVSIAGSDESVIGTTTSSGVALRPAIDAQRDPMRPIRSVDSSRATPLFSDQAQRRRDALQR